MDGRDKVKAFVKAVDENFLSATRTVDIPMRTVNGMATSDMSVLQATNVPVIRVYMPDLTTSWAADEKCQLCWARGGAPLLSFTTQTWAQPQLGNFQARLKELAGRPIILSFNHEPEDDGAKGTPADFAARFGDYVLAQRAYLNVPNIKWAWIMMGWTFNLGSKKNPMDWYPGDLIVDYVGADVYDWAQFHNVGHVPLSQVAGPALGFAAAHSKRLIIPEYGFAPGTPSSPFDRIAAIKTAYAWANANGVAVMAYFNRADPVNKAIDWTLTAAERAAIFV